MASFSLDDAIKANETWGANCGPGALAGIVGLPLDGVRVHLPDFDRKRYTNPVMMWAALKSLGVAYHMVSPLSFPGYGLARIQWHGPWMRQGVSIRARYRRTHWVGAHWLKTRGQRWIFDINCMCVGGWVRVDEWAEQVVPWLLKETTPKADGGWSITHAIELQPINAQHMLEG